MHADSIVDMQDTILSVFRPPAFSDVIQPLFLSQSFQLESRISQDAVKNTASAVLPVSVSQISEMNHLVDKFQRLDDMLVARFHALTLSGKGLISRYHGKAAVDEFSSDWIRSVRIILSFKFCARS